MREAVPDIALDGSMPTIPPARCASSGDGLLDIGVMYQPRQMPGLVVETLYEETLVLVGTEARPATKKWLEDYVFVDWGDVFRDAHAEAFPEMETPALSVGHGELALYYIMENGGSGFFPLARGRSPGGGGQAAFAWKACAPGAPPGLHGLRPRPHQPSPPGGRHRRPPQGRRTSTG